MFIKCYDKTNMKVFALIQLGLYLFCPVYNITSNTKNKSNESAHFTLVLVTVSINEGFM